MQTYLKRFEKLVLYLGKVHYNTKGFDALESCDKEI